MNVTILTLTCVRCGRQLRAQSVGAYRPDPCPVCLTNTVIPISSRSINDPTQIPDKRATHHDTPRRSP